MSNPYQAPFTQPPNPRPSSLVQAPAIALIAVAALAIILGLLGLLGDIFLYSSGAIDQLEAENDGPISEYTQIIVRSIWGGILVVAACFVLYGAIQMKRMRSYGIALAAAIVAAIPMLGPCCIVGIPFGIWAIVVLTKPEVKRAFE
jgi:hypothetical protein